MNVYDSARMADVLAPLGYGLTATPDGADMMILNTCHIREKAAAKVYSELGRIRQMKARRQAAGKDTVIAVAGWASSIPKSRGCRSGRFSRRPAT